MTSPLPIPVLPTHLEGLSREELLRLACTLARLGAVLCDVGKVGSEQRYGIVDEHPYIWDLKED